MKLPFKLNHRLYLTPIKEEIRKMPHQLNENNLKEQDQLIDTYLQSKSEQIKQLINDTNSRNDFSYHQSTRKQVLRFKPNPKLIKPIIFMYSKQLIDIYNISPGDNINKKQFSSTIYYPKNNHLRSVKNINCSHHISKIQRYRKYFIPNIKTNYFKKEGIIPGINKINLNKSISMINRSPNTIRNKSFSFQKHISINGKQKNMTPSKSELRMVKYKIKII